MSDSDELTLKILPPAFRGEQSAVAMPGRGGDLDSLAHNVKRKIVIAHKTQA